MKILSLFDGMSCGRIAFDRLNIPVEKYYSSEIDKYSQIVSQANYPDIIPLGDITKWREWDIEQPDIIIGGSPCQGFSFAGKRLNLEDERSKLFFEFRDIVRHYKPKYFLLENVRMDEESENVISREMGIQPVLINSALVSAQNRQRLYWTNINAGSDLFGFLKPEISQPIDKEVYLENIIECGYVDRKKSYCIDANYGKGGNLKRYFKRSSRQLVFDNSDCKKYRMLKPGECEILQNVPKNYTNHVSNSQRYKMLGNGWTVDVICHILKHMDNSNEI